VLPQPIADRQSPHVEQVARIEDILRAAHHRIRSRS
jgi:hypothetical protein